MKEIPSNTAKEQLIKIDKELKEPHILIGGLAVQQYHPPRVSNDIDLICDYETAKKLIDKLYPTKFYDIREDNKDDYRPAFVITSKTNDEKIIFIGPKIIEREPYTYINWEKLKKDSQSFKVQKTELENIKILSIEALAYTKLISFLCRIKTSKMKGEQDLLDFVNLSNNTSFRTNFLINLIQTNKCEKFIISSLVEISGNYDERIWEDCLLFDFLKNSLDIQLKRDIINSDPDTEVIRKIFTPENSIPFYNKVANFYDSRNTNSLYKGHQAIISQIINLLPEGGRIIDIGCGTGRLIAAHFLHYKNIAWIGIDGSSKMLDMFKEHTKEAKMNVKVLNSKIEEIDWKILADCDLCIICFTLTSLPNIDFLTNVAENIKMNGLLLIADIHPARTIQAPYYEFSINTERIALKPIPVYLDTIIEYLLPKNFTQISQQTILGNDNHKYAYISIFKKIQCDENKATLNEKNEFKKTHLSEIFNSFEKEIFELIEEEKTPVVEILNKILEKIKSNTIQKSQYMNLFEKIIESDNQIENMMNWLFNRRNLSNYNVSVCDYLLKKIVITFPRPEIIEKGLCSGYNYALFEEIMMDLIKNEDLIDTIIEKIGICISDDTDPPRYPQKKAKSIIKKIIERNPLDEKRQTFILNLPFSDRNKQELKQAIIDKTSQP